MFFLFVAEVPSKEARRVFVLLTKTLQSLANAIKLGGKEQHMAKLNDFIDENQNEINQFFDQCAVRTSRLYFKVLFYQRLTAFLSDPPRRQLRS